jgi:hypothetical protein
VGSSKELRRGVTGFFTKEGKIPYVIQISDVIDLSDDNMEEIRNVIEKIKNNRELQVDISSLSALQKGLIQQKIDSITRNDF